MGRNGRLNSKNTTSKEDKKKKIKDLFIVKDMVHALAGLDAMRLALGEDALYNDDDYEDWEDEIFND